MMNKDIIVIGASGFGKEVAWLAEECGRKVVGFLDDGKEIGDNIYNYNVIDKIENFHKYNNHEFVIAIGNPRVRKKIANTMPNNVFATLVHPNVIKSSAVSIGKGTIICAGNVLTVDVRIGSHVHLNLNGTIGHDCDISDFVTIAPLVAVSGNVIAERGVEIGTGASVRQGVLLRTGSMIGMGGVVTKEVAANSIYLGNPAKHFKELEEF